MKRKQKLVNSTPKQKRKKDDGDSLGSGNMFECPTCHKMYKTQWSLENHMMRHLDPSQRVLKCDLCEKTFDKKILLQYHMKTAHLSEEEKAKQMIPCEVCGKKFLGKKLLRAHIGRVHEGKRYPCTYCDKVYPSPHGLKYHIKSIHEGKNKVDISVEKNLIFR